MKITLGTEFVNCLREFVKVLPSITLCSFFRRITILFTFSYDLGFGYPGHQGTNGVIGFKGSKGEKGEKGDTVGKVISHSV